MVIKLTLKYQEFPSTVCKPTFLVSVQKSDSVLASNFTEEACL